MHAAKGVEHPYMHAGASSGHWRLTILLFTLFQWRKRKINNPIRTKLITDFDTISPEPRVLCAGISKTAG